MLLALGSLPPGAASAQVAPDEPPPVPEVLRQHALLARHAGTWDAAIEAYPRPDGPPVVSAGVETNRLVGGLWLVTEFRGEILGRPVEGHGLLGYDPARRRYVNAWVDTLSFGISTGQFTFDPATATLAGVVEGPDMTGAPVRARHELRYAGEDRRVLTVHATDEAGRASLALRITYTRR